MLKRAKSMQKMEEKDVKKGFVSFHTAKLLKTPGLLLSGK